ncbi:hypothetical protein TW95_gp1145 [Pandoravirus inopinatum]|uniref:Uncharacterized protein n=1 Tax=Pandoravirus inopinatum TaxID=1605721 RepID=A0A0B5J2S9_9VIRU|nr:hypothetical protein TW95_gp1145 [Pandoravirus inopinatum]AJF97879.1 hypothetical protein [Pandoravirus inopinatum]
MAVVARKKSVRWSVHSSPPSRQRFGLVVVVVVEKTDHGPTSEWKKMEKRLETFPFSFFSLVGGEVSLVEGFGVARGFSFFLLCLFAPQSPSLYPRPAPPAACRASFGSVSSVVSPFTPPSSSWSARPPCLWRIREPPIPA